MSKSRIFDLSRIFLDKYRIACLGKSGFILKVLWSIPGIDRVLGNEFNKGARIFFPVRPVFFVNQGSERGLSFQITGEDDS